MSKAVAQAGRRGLKAAQRAANNRAVEAAKIDPNGTSFAGRGNISGRRVEEGVNRILARYEGSLINCVRAAFAAREGQAYGR